MRHKKSPRTPNCILLLIILSGVFLSSCLAACDKIASDANCAAYPAAISAVAYETFYTQCCSEPVIPTPSPSTTAATTPTPPQTTTVTPQAPIDLHLAHRTAAVWLDITGSFPRKYLTEALHVLADTTDGLIEPGMGGMTIYVSVIAHDSYSPDATLLVRTIAALPADPPLPALELSPQGGSDVEQAQNDQQTQTDNCATLTSYYATLAKSHAALPAIQQHVKEQVTDPIRHLKLPPPDDIATDLFGAIERSSDWFQGETGERWFIGITDLINNTNQQRSGSIAFNGVAVRIDWHYCGNDTDESATFCISKSSWWVGFFQKAGASSVKLLDPAQSEALGPNLFS